MINIRYRTRGNSVPHDTILQYLINNICQPFYDDLLGKILSYKWGVFQTISVQRWIDYKVHRSYELHYNEMNIML